jgi:hypothetical protein
MIEVRESKKCECFLNRTVRLIFMTLTIIPENVHVKIDELEE